MKTQSILTLAGSVVVLAAGAVTLQAFTQAQRGAAPRAEAPAPQDPGGVVDLLFARPFTLDQGYVHSWRAEAPEVTSGWLLVLDVEAHLVEPKSEFEPILYGGDQTVERVNHGHASGRVIAVLPGSVNLDLARLPLWFGEPGLPEEVTAASLATARAAAEDAGVEPFAPSVVAAARELGGEAVALPDRTALHRMAAELILEWSPADEELAQGMLAPLVR